MAALALSLGVLLLYMSGLFVLALLKHNNGTADIGYGLGFIVVIAAALYFSHTHNYAVYLLALMPLAWGLRLATRIFLKNYKKPEDFRYKAWRDEWGKWFVFRSFLQVYMLQGVIIFLVALPVTLSIVFPSAQHLPSFFAAGSAIWMIGFFFESIADFQLDRFIHNPANKGKIMTEGLWRYSRHPNYFGESIMWWGLAVAGLGLSQFALLGFISPLLITFLLLFVSGVPLLEKRWAGNPEWESYKRRTSVFVPLPPKSSGKKKKLLIAALAVVLALACVYLCSMPAYTPMLPTTTLTIGNNTIEAELAATESEREQGLSGRTFLPDGKGMFFVFDSLGAWGIWMKDMRFPIDILWADQNGTIITIKENASPESYPANFSPAGPALYVLEVPAGYAKKHNVGVGSKIVVQ